MRLYIVGLRTPYGPAVLEVPSAFGPDVAKRRAIMAAAAAGWGDLGEIRATWCETLPADETRTDVLATVRASSVRA